MENEIWKDILGYEERYQASNLGNIRSLRYEGHNCIRLLKQHKRGKYWRVSLHTGKKQITYTVSRLVWEAFNGKIPDGMEVNHIDENTDNNKLSNLNLTSKKDNCNWGTRNKRIAEKLTNGKKCIPILQYDLEGNLIREWISNRQVYKELGYNCSAINMCCKNHPHSKTAYGYIWKYKRG